MGKIIVTGGHGFIGSNLVKYLNSRGLRDIIVVDTNDNGYLKDANVSKYYSIEEFTMKLLTLTDFSFHKDEYFKDVDAVFHLGAKVDTSSTDPNVFDYNFSFSKLLFQYCHEYRIPLFYASSAACYGITDNFKEDNLDIHPLNIYGKAKHLFDEYVAKNDFYKDQGMCYGFRFFNVYGPNEFHKGKMCSAITQIYLKGRFKKNITLFKSIDPNYKDGEQARDFIPVRDVVSILYTFYTRYKLIPSGIYNIGMGKATSFIDIAEKATKVLNNDSTINFIETPEELKKCYQTYTKADMTKTSQYHKILRCDDCDDGITRYFKYLNTLPDETFEDLLNKIYK